MKRLFVIIFAALFSHASAAQTYVLMVKHADEKQWGYVNLDGDFIIEPKFAKCFPFSKDGLALFQNPDTRQLLFVNLKGKIIKPDIELYKSIKSFENGLAPIKQDKFWGYINTEGKVVVKPKYDDVSYFNGGFAVVRSGSQYIILDKAGEELPVEISDLKGVRDFSEELAPYHTINGVFGFINTEGKIAIPAQFASVGYFINGLAWAKTSSGLVGYINKGGDWVIKPQFEAAKDFEAESELARIKKSDRWGYVNKSGEISYFTDAEVWGDFAEGLCKGKRNGMYGFFDQNGDWAIEPVFEGVRDFKNGYAAAKKNGKWGIIDKTGKWRLEPTFDGIRDVELVPN